MRQIYKKSPAPPYCVTALWLIWATFFPMYALWHFIVLFALSALVWGSAAKRWPGRVIELPEPAPATEPVATGNPELDALLAERNRAVAEMRRLNDSILDEKISGQIDELEATTAKIFDHVMQNPQKLTQLRRFLHYYLPTTLKLLNTYDRMGEQGLRGENIGGTMKKIEEMLDTIVEAFHRQLDALFGEEALDIGSDIAVMENLLAQEGLGGSRMGR